MKHAPESGRCPECNRFLERTTGRTVRCSVCCAEFLSLVPSSAMETDPIKLASIEELYLEIASRCLSSVLIIREATKLAKDEQDAHRAWHRGGWAAAIGLCEYAKHYWLEKDAENTEAEPWKPEQ